MDALEDGLVIEHRRQPWLLKVHESNFELASTDDESKTIDVPFFRVDSVLTFRSSRFSLLLGRKDSPFDITCPDQHTFRLVVLAFKKRGFEVNMSDSIRRMLDFDTNRKHFVSVQLRDGSRHDIIRIMKRIEMPEGHLWTPAEYSAPVFIGQGSYGSVIKFHDEEAKKDMAAKYAMGLFQNMASAKRTIREIIILRHLSHPNIVRIQDIFPPTRAKFNEAVFIMEKEPFNLHNIIVKHIEQRKEWLSVDDVLSLSFQLLKAVDYLQRKRIIHRDIKPGNILINDQYTLKLCDFGLARVMEDLTFDQESENEVKMTQKVTTRSYRAPEVMLTVGEYGYEVDLWSTGCVLGEMMMALEIKRDLLEGKESESSGSICPILFRGDSVGDVIQAILRITGSPDEQEKDFLSDERALNFLEDMPYIAPANLRDLFSSSPDDLWGLLRDLLRFDPRQRISTSEALESPLFEHLWKESDEHQRYMREESKGDFKNIETTVSTEEERNILEQRTTSKFIDMFPLEMVDPTPDNYRTLILKEMYPFFRHKGRRGNTDDYFASKQQED